MKQYIAVGCLLGSLVSCATALAPEEHSILGVYKVLERNCAGSDTQIDACKNITLLEFVKGNFYKVGNNEVAFAIWSGNPAEELLYTAKKYIGMTVLDKFPSSVMLADDNSYQEKLQFLTYNNATYTFGQPGGAMSELKIGRISKRESAKFKKEYPGNQ